jgi:hypothetical protein
VKKILSFALLLGLTLAVVLEGERAEASSSAQSTNATSQSVTSATFSLAAVAKSTDGNGGAALAVTITGQQGFFYLKNFGTTTLNGFSMTQVRPNSTVRYCVGQEFKAGDATTCFDNTAPILVGSSKTLPDTTFTSPLSPGSFYAFSCVVTGGGTNTFSVSVSRANITNQNTSS